MYETHNFFTEEKDLSINQLTIFNDKNLGSVRKIVDKDSGKCWYVAEDVCKCLDLKNVSRACSDLFHGEINTLSISELDKNGAIRTNTHLVISDEAVLLLCMHSNTNAARRFQRWIVKNLLSTNLMNTSK